MLILFYMSFSSHDDSSFSFFVDLFDIIRIVDDSSCREIRTFDDFHDFIDTYN